ncbi:MAG: hypothetical protein ABFE13_13545 [Phycisphaerales bacterium]
MNSLGRPSFGSFALHLPRRQAGDAGFRAGEDGVQVRTSFTVSEKGWPMQ